MVRAVAAEVGRRWQGLFLETAAIRSGFRQEGSALEFGAGEGRVSSVESPLSLRQINIRFIDPYLNTGAAVSAKVLVDADIKDPVSESKLTDSKALAIGDGVLRAVKIDTSTAISLDYSHDNIDTRAVFEFVVDERPPIRLAYSYPDVMVWINVQAFPLASPSCQEARPDPGCSAAAALARANRLTFFQNGANTLRYRKIGH